MANAKVTIEADVSAAQAALNKLVTSLGTLESSMGKVNQSFASAKTSTDALSGALGKMIAAFSVATIVKAADAYTQYSNQLKSVATDQGNLNTSLSEVAKIANETGTPLGMVAGLYTKLTVAGNNLGISQERILRATESITKQTKLYGLDAANAASVTYQFGQAVGMGVARTEELKQIMEASPQFIKGMAEAFGKTTTQFMADVAAMKVGSEDLIAAQEWQLNKINPMWKNYQKTVGESLQTISNNFSIFLGRLETSTGIFAKVGAALDWMGKNIDIVAAAVSALFVIWSVEKIIGIAKAMGILNAVMAANPILRIASALLAVGTAVAMYMGVSKEATAILEAESEAQKKLNQETLKYKGPQIDVGALKEAAGAFLKQYELQAKIAGMGKIQQEQERAIFQFAQQNKVSYEAAEKAVGGILRAQIAATAIAEEHAKISNDQKAAYDAMFIAFQGINGLSLQEMETRLNILNIERQLGIALGDKQKKQIASTIEMQKEVEYLKQTKALMENINKAQSGSQAMATAAGSLTGLSPQAAADQALTSQQTLQNGLQELRLRGLINEQTYQQALVGAAQQAQAQIFAATKARYEQEGLLRAQSMTGTQFNFETQKQMAQEYANFQMKTDMEKSAFALDQASQMFTALGAQNRKAFEAAKAFNIANAIMNTYMAATKALATYPPPFSFIAAAAAVGMGLAQVAQIRSQQYSGRALGGPVMAGTSYIVGENGPELFTPNTTGSITRNQDLGSAQPVNVNFTIVANDTTSFDALLNNRKGMIKQLISDAMLDKGQRF